MRWLAIAALIAAAACGSTSPDLTSRSAEGTYSLTSQGLVPGGSPFITHDGTIFNTDVYVLTAGSWARSYVATNVPVGGGPNTQFSGTLTGTYDRAGTVITLHRTGAADLTGHFTGTGMSIIEGDYLLTYALQ